MQTQRHTHNGVDSQQIELRDVQIVLGSPLSIADNTALTSGGLTALTTPDSLVIENIRTRLNELEARLKSLGLIQ
jgi:hypothetical protein